MIALSELGQPSESLANYASEFFGESGALSGLKDFEYRRQQQQMAVAVGEALDEERPLVVEAGTGVGKSLAYLAPAVKKAISERRKAIVSTHTINLQEQLIEKRYPAAADRSR